MEKEKANPFGYFPGLEGKRIVIMGGTSGIGLAAGKSFLASGAKVVAVGLENEFLEKAQAVYSGENILLAGDAILPDTAVRAVEICAEKWGGLDGLFHVAGGSGRKWGDGPIHKLSAEGWQKTLELNLSSVMYSNQAAIRFWLDRATGGAILNVGSVLAFSPSPSFFATHAYTAAKSAITGLTLSLAATYAPHNIRANVLAPGLVESPMSRRAAENERILQFIKTKQPLAGGRIGTPDDLTGMACYALSDLSAFTTGQVFYVDGGWRISEGQIPPEI
ncbi:MAG: SDR family oxidoreductase [Bacteroidia bacterium]|nr:SDR family oxidoreductase [Bacteroidia bacterium]